MLRVYQMNPPQLLDPWLGRLLGDRKRYRLEERLGAVAWGMSSSQPIPPSVSQ